MGLGFGGGGITRFGLILGAGGGAAAASRLFAISSMAAHPASATSSNAIITGTAGRVELIIGFVLRLRGNTSKPPSPQEINALSPSASKRETDFAFDRIGDWCGTAAGL